MSPFEILTYLLIFMLLVFFVVSMTMLVLMFISRHKAIKEYESKRSIKKHEIDL